MERKKSFFKDAFEDMAESAHIQREASAANFEAAKLEAAARFEKAKSETAAKREESKNRPARNRDAAFARKAAAQEKLDSVRADRAGE